MDCLNLKVNNVYGEARVVHGCDGTWYQNSGIYLEENGASFV